ncbi:hypothetical protein SAMN05421878_1323 [Actinobaculum suis]|uniref:Uncharacterized protein n=1 Tax=Actinobaculum suis TaxID=1657 RepID=A0A0K9EVM8_9ACTO|nr:hypothetical protein [Actinobaculum suis]KMY23922.1 hypothetical protein ACU19_01380 [Actinobaculum suis]MDY5153685.1 hypothetical protein [Actinobaculum suis]OCA93600.1 hypothetical protein ACU21_00905 [Actinobaculum suis]OCA93876.1 hypothetical protein ACU20_00615 [Actinobaculum suis]SDE69164.1 hypothetical protein SAMN05421878_1323 [Actinobaculum suis]
MYLHAEEEFQVWPVEEYASANLNNPLSILFEDGEHYSGVFFTATDSDNGGELDIDIADPRYDEFHQVVFEIVESIKAGRRRYGKYLAIDYRDFPVLITDLISGVVVYSVGQDPSRAK